MNKIADYIGKDVIVYEGTPTQPFGGLFRVLDSDSVSSYPEISFLVISRTEASLGDFGAIPKWVKLEDIKQIVSYTRPTGTWFKLKQKVRQWLMHVLKPKLLPPSEG